MPRLQWPACGYYLEEAFAQLITGGPGSFVITADGKDRFAEAVLRKLLLEIADLSGENVPSGPKVPM